MEGKKERGREGGREDRAMGHSKKGQTNGISGDRKAEAPFPPESTKRGPLSHRYVCEFESH